MNERELELVIWPARIQSCSVTFWRYLRSRPLRLDKLKRIEQEATAGPWHYDKGNACYPVLREGIFSKHFPVLAVCLGGLSKGKLEVRLQDIIFLTASREAMPKLIALVEAADRGEKARARVRWCLKKGTGQQTRDATKERDDAEKAYRALRDGKEKKDEIPKR